MTPPPTAVGIGIGVGFGAPVGGAAPPQMNGQPPAPMDALGWDSGDELAFDGSGPGTPAGWDE